MSIAALPQLIDPFHRDSTSAAQTRAKFLQLQTLVSVILSYQVLFGQQFSVPHDVQLASILGLLLTCAAIIILPPNLIESSWFPGFLALSDTAITTILIYLSGQASSDIYLTYFIIILIATMAQTTKQLFISLGIMSIFYGSLLYREVEQTGVLQEHHLLRIPLFIVMAIFYGGTVDAARSYAENDALTGLPNRQKFLAMVSRALERAKRSNDTLALLFLNLDGFKLINDSLGRRVGDLLLRAVTNRIREAIGKGRALAREGGDEFTLLMRTGTSPQKSIQLANHLLRTMSPPFMIRGHEIFMSLSIGIARFPQDGITAEALVNNADAAMLYAKSQGRNRYQIFSPDMETQDYQRLEMETNLRKALGRNEFRVYYQPKVDVITGQIVGMEALIRWEHPTFGLVSPGQFIGIAEETGLVAPIGEWVLKESCRQVKEWQDQGLPPVCVAVNLAAPQLQDEDLVTLVSQTLEDVNLSSHLLELELTESMIMKDTEKTVHVLQSLKALGLQLSVDDFGTGYSSLSYLKRFPIDRLKIDQSFVRDLTTNVDSRAIVKAIIGMAHALKLKVIAEGVEDEQQLTVLQEEGCQEYQGYYYSRPLPAEEMAKLMQERPASPVHSA